MLPGRPDQRRGERTAIPMRERDACSVEKQREHVATERVRAEAEVAVGWKRLALERQAFPVLEVRIVRCEDGRESRRRRAASRFETEHGRPVVHESAKRLAPVAALASSRRPARQSAQTSPTRASLARRRNGELRRRTTEHKTRLRIDPPIRERGTRNANTTALDGHKKCIIRETMHDMAVTVPVHPAVASPGHSVAA